MNWSLFFTIISILLAVFVFIFLLVRTIFSQLEKQRKESLNRKVSKQILPVQLQAYERLTLLLERITPESLVLRNEYAPYSIQQYRVVLLKAVKEEFDHNLSQQIYVSEKAWSYLLAARQSIIQLITETAAKMNTEDQTSDYVNDLFDEFSEISDDPVSVAKQFLHKEVAVLLLK